ncbi:Fc.00g046630.m01.CDS01 [Cosmosporella sp. VM-42]
MFQQRGSLEWNPSGSIIQDAMAIVLFPRDIAPEDRTLVIEAHLRKWGAGDFSAEFKGTSTDTRRQLETLYKILWRYIEDYLSKIGLAKGAHRLKREDLGQEDQNRLLQGFLRYELLCKVYRPTGGQLCETPRFHKKSTVIEVDDMHHGYESDPTNAFLHWDWVFLYKYESKGIGFEEPPMELLLLPYAREYVLTMYGALIVDQLRVTLPTSDGNAAFANAPTKGHRGLPDYDLDSRWERLHHLGRRWLKRTRCLVDGIH